MTEKQREIATNVTVDENTGQVIGLSTHDYAEHDVDKRVGQFSENTQSNQQQVIFSFHQAVEKMTTEQRIEATTKAVFQIQAEFIDFESKVARLLQNVSQAEKMLNKMYWLLIILGVMLGICLVLLIVFWIYLAFQQH